MAKINKSILDLIGNTPLLEAENIERAEGLEATVLLKLEYFNPAGSVKDRIARAMIEDAEKTGRYRPCCHCSIQRIQDHPDHAGNNEC